MENRSVNLEKSIKKYLNELGDTLKLIQSSLKISKKDFEECLAAEMQISSSSIHQLLLPRPQSMPLSWADITEQENNITRLKKGLGPAIEKYIQDSSKDAKKRKTVEESWIKYKDIFLSLLEFEWYVITCSQAIDYLKPYISKECLDKYIFTLFLKTNWEAESVQDVEQAKRMMSKIQQYIKDNVDTAKYTYSDDEMEIMNEYIKIAKKLPAEEIHIFPESNMVKDPDDSNYK